MACCAPEERPHLRARSLVLCRSQWERPEQGLRGSLAQQGTFCWVCCPLLHWAFPASSQRDSGFPTELAAARHPGPCAGNTTWFLHHLLLAPGDHSEEQRYRAHPRPGASAGRGQEGLAVQHSSPGIFSSLPLPNRWPAGAGVPDSVGLSLPSALRPCVPWYKTLPWGRQTLASSPTKEIIRQVYSNLCACRDIPAKNFKTTYASLSRVLAKLVMEKPTVGHNMFHVKKEKDWAG